MYITIGGMFSTVNTPSKSKPTFFFLIILTTFLLIVSHHGTTTAARTKTTTNIGVIINVNTRIGKEVKVAMKIAAQNFHKTSIHNKLSLHFHNHSGNPLQAAYAAEELVKEKNVQALIGMETWEEAALVADVGNRLQVPIISFASLPQQIVQQQWPFLVQMTSNFTEQIKCIAAIVRSFNWQKVIPLYELDTYGGDSGLFVALTQALQDIGVEIEYPLAIPHFSSLSDPNMFVREIVAKLVTKQSRVFVILQSSLSLATHLFREAKQNGLIGKDSAWILTDCIASLLDSVDTSVISSIQGAIGIKTYFSEDNRPFVDFKHQFKKTFRLEYPEEDNSEMGIYALRAHDSIFSLTKAIKKLSTNTTTTPNSTILLGTNLSTNFLGSRGDMHLYRIVNVVGKRYKELGFWSSSFGFSSEEKGEKTKGDSMESFVGLVNWPGDLNRVPKGWLMPTDAKPMKIGVPGRTSFEKFVKVEWDRGSNETNYFGFCIDVFYEALKIVETSYSLPYEFIPFYGTYDELVDNAINKTYDAVIGDVTILANRSRYVEFTQPYADSGLTIVVSVKPQAEKAWIFLKPFTQEMWAVTAVILGYTVFIVWLLEGQSNPEFEGPWPNQLATALWFTSSMLFFAHREKVHNNYTRVVVMVWLFVVLALTSSYTASLSSMLTVPRLVPNVTDVKWLKMNNATVGCDGDSFVRKYLEDVLKFKHANIKNISSEYNYPGEFESGNITAAFLELPYEKAFFNHYCKGYTVLDTHGKDRFGGLGFVFQKGSPIATDFSDAILTLLENGKLKQLETKWFAPSSNCSSQTPDKTDSLSWHSFWGLYLFSAITSTTCYLAFVTRQLYQRLCEAYNNMRNKLAVCVYNLLHNNRTIIPSTTPTILQAPVANE